MTERRISRARFVAASSAAFASIAIASPARAAQWTYK